MVGEVGVERQVRRVEAYIKGLKVGLEVVSEPLLLSAREYARAHREGARACPCGRVVVLLFERVWQSGCMT